MSIRIIGGVLLVVGAILLFFGINAAESPADQVTETLTGRFREATMLYIIFGAIGVVVGGGMLLFGRRS